MKEYKRKYVESGDSSDEALKIGYRFGKLGLPEKTEFLYDKEGTITAACYLKKGFVNILIPEEKKKELLSGTFF